MHPATFIKVDTIVHGIELSLFNIPGVRDVNIVALSSCKFTLLIAALRRHSSKTRQPTQLPGKMFDIYTFKAYWRNRR